MAAFSDEDLVYGHGKQIMEGHVAFESGIVSWHHFWSGGHFGYHMGVSSSSWGYPPSWMV